jgi:hypothetical protein
MPVRSLLPESLREAYSASDSKAAGAVLVTLRLPADCGLACPVCPLGDELLCTAKMIRKITTTQITTMITSARCRLTAIRETSITQRLQKRRVLEGCCPRSFVKRLAPGSQAARPYTELR